MLCKLAHVIFIILLVYRLQTTEHIPVNQNGFCIYFAIFFHMQRMDERIEKISGARWWVDQYFSLITERIPIFSGFEKVIFGVSFGKKKKSVFCCSSPASTRSLLMGRWNQCRFLRSPTKYIFLYLYFISVLFIFCYCKFFQAIYK